MAPIVADNSSSCACDKCNVMFKKSDITVKCAGFCNKLYHSQCVNLKDSDVRIINSKGDGFGWTCRMCRQKIAEQAPIMQYLDCILNMVKDNFNKLHDHSQKIDLVLSKFCDKSSSNLEKCTNPALYISDEANASPSEVQSVDISSKITDNSKRLISREQVATAIATAQKQTFSKSSAKTISTKKPVNTRYQERINRPNVNDPKSKNRNTNKQTVTGTAEVIDQKFAAVPIKKRTWIHASNFHKDLTSDDLAEFLRSKLNTDDFICQKIIPKHRSPTFSSFKIGADINLKQKLLDPTFWYQGISVTEFNFFRANRNGIQFEKQHSQQDINADNN